jgi:2'-5' RNA ligase
MSGDIYNRRDFVGHSLWLVPPEPVARRIGDLIQDLAARLAFLAADCPTFTPHVTLLAGLRDRTDEDVIAKTEEVAADFAPLAINLQRVVAGPKFFMCVYALAQQTPQLMAANAAAQSVFGLSYEYTPHMSLAYGEDSRLGAAAKAEAVAAAEARLRALHSTGCGDALPETSVVTAGEEAGGGGVGGASSVGLLGAIKSALGVGSGGHSGSASETGPTAAGDAGLAATRDTDGSGGEPLLSFHAGTVEVWRTAGPVEAWVRLAAFDLGGASKGV